MKEDLGSLGYEVVDIHNKGYQFRINGAIDLYPKSQKFFDLFTKEWGTYTNVLELLGERLKVREVNINSNSDLKKQWKVEQVIYNIEQRLVSKKITDDTKKIMLEEIIKLL